MERETPLISDLLDFEHLGSAQTPEKQIVIKEAPQRRASGKLTVVVA